MSTTTAVLRFAVSVLAPLIGTIEFLPQLYKTYQLKHVRDLSLYSLLLVLFANILWLVHGYMISDASLIVGGTISIAINSALLGLYFLYYKERKGTNKNNNGGG